MMFRSRHTWSSFSSPHDFLGRSRFAPLGALLALFFLSGCVTFPESPRVVPTGDPVVDGNAWLAVAPPQDRVVWDYRIAASALRAGNFPEARAKLDDAISRIGGILANDAAAKKARGLFSPERGKTFIGEPYERAMAYYYRGLLYWRDGEPDNARACFRSAQLVDADAESETYKSDYILLDYLDGLVSTKLHGDGGDARARAQKVAKHDLPAYDLTANALFFLEWGEGPRKYAAGQYGEQLRFHVEPSRVRSASLTIGNRTLNFTPWDNLNYQAVTRGGRVMDYILGNKAVFKQGADAVGDVALTGAVIASDNIYKDQDEPRRPVRRGDPRRDDPPPEKKPEKNYDAENTAIALGVVGVVSKIASAATAPEADTRMWDNLPQYLSFAAIPLPAGKHPAVLQFFDAQGHLIADLTRRLTLTVDAPARDTVVILSELKH